MDEGKLLSWTKEFFSKNPEEIEIEEKASEESTSEPEVLDSKIPDDVYQSGLESRLEANKSKIAKGSRPKTMRTLGAVLTLLRPAHQKAKDDSDVLRAMGDNQRAGIVEEQYIQEKFLPAVEAMVSFSSLDEVLNNKKLLSELDKYATLSKRSGSGYSEAYLRSAYPDGRGKYEVGSDAMVRDAVIKVRKFSNRGELRLAISIAQKIKDKIDSGKNVASQDDYDFIQRVVLRGTKPKKAVETFFNL